MKMVALLLLLCASILVSEAAPPKEQLVAFYPITRAQYNAILSMTGGKPIISEGRLLSNGLKPEGELRSVSYDLGNWSQIFNISNLMMNDDKSNGNRHGSKMDGYPMCVIKTSDINRRPYHDYNSYGRALKDNDESGDEVESKVEARQGGYYEIYDRDRYRGGDRNRPIVNCVVVVKRPAADGNGNGNWNGNGNGNGDGTGTENNGDGTRITPYPYAPPPYPYPFVMPTANRRRPALDGFPSYPSYPSYAGHPMTPARPFYAGYGGQARPPKRNSRPTYEDSVSSAEHKEPHPRPSSPSSPPTSAPTYPSPLHPIHIAIQPSITTAANPPSRPASSTTSHTAPQTAPHPASYPTSHFPSYSPPSYPPPSYPFPSYPNSYTPPYSSPYPSPYHQQYASPYPSYPPPFYQPMPSTSPHPHYLQPYGTEVVSARAGDTKEKRKKKTTTTEDAEGRSVDYSQLLYQQSLQNYFDAQQPQPINPYSIYGTSSSPYNEQTNPHRQTLSPYGYAHAFGHPTSPYGVFPAIPVVSNSADRNREEDLESSDEYFDSKERK